MNNLKSGDPSKRELSWINIPKVRMKSPVTKWKKEIFSHVCLTQNVYFGGRWKHSYFCSAKSIMLRTLNFQKF